MRDRTVRICQWKCPIPSLVGSSVSSSMRHGKLRRLPVASLFGLGTAGPYVAPRWGDVQVATAWMSGLVEPCVFDMSCIFKHVYFNEPEHVLGIPLLFMVW